MNHTIRLSRGVLFPRLKLCMKIAAIVAVSIIAWTIAAGTAFAAVPVAVADFYTTPQNTELVVEAPGILANDTDAGGDPMTAELVISPTNGALTFSADGAFRYTPDKNFHGNDSFTYKAYDGSEYSSIATVNISVNSVPVAVANNYSTKEDTPLTVSAADGVLKNDYDVDLDTITVVNGAHPASHGSVTMSPEGRFTYTPEANYNGIDSFTYRITDGLEISAEATVTIIISPENDAPVAANDAFSIDEDTVLNVPFPGVLSNDADVDGDALIPSIAGGPGHGTLVLNEDGSLSYTPASGYYGPDSFTYVVNDGKVNSNPATVAIEVKRVNHVPVTGYEAYSTAEDTPLTVAAPGVLANDNDPDGDTLTAVLVSIPGIGALTLDANGRFVYAPAANFHGQDSFVYKAFDGLGYSDPRTVTVTVNSVNDIPYAANDEYWIDEDNTLQVQATGVLGNDNDVDGDALTAYLVSGPSHGSLTLYGNGSFTYKPSHNYNGQDSFTYRAGDGNANSTTATVKINVNPVKDPVSVGDISHTAFPLQVGETVKIDLHYWDIDGDSRTAKIFWGDGEVDWAGIYEKDGTGTIYGEYAYSKPGNYTITVWIMDGSGTLITRDTGVFSVVTTKTVPPNANQSTGAANPAESVPAAVSPTPVVTATPQPPTDSTPASGGWQSWALYAAILGLLATAGVGGYLAFFRRKG